MCYKHISFMSMSFVLIVSDAADNVVKGQGKFEQLTVASQEIAASTAQLVFASRVKAESRSKNLQALADSSRAVSSATGGVVATAKHCAGLIEDSSKFKKDLQNTLVVYFFFCSTHNQMCWISHI